MSESEHLFTIRSQMALLGIDAYVVLSSDQHMSEYIANHWKYRHYVSGFDGSAGTLVITHERAGLWTDSRYYLQAEQQLEDSEIELFRLGMPDVPEYRDWLATELEPTCVVGVDGRTMSLTEFNDFSSALRKNDIRIDSRINMMDEVWFDREPISENDVFELDTSVAGLSRTQKAKKVMEMMNDNDVTHYVVCALDEIAWMLNLRGSDVDYNPVFHAFMVVSQNHVNLFIDPHKVTATIGKKLEDDQIRVFHYNDFYKFVKEMPSHSQIYYDPQKTNVQAVNSIPPKAVKKEGQGFITQLKAIKNSVEIQGSHKAHLHDGVAMVNFLCWLDQNVGSGQLTEISCSDRLLEYRKQQEGFVGESFGPISGYAAHGAIVHYSATDASNVVLHPKGLYLLDSGGQYLWGTTDITRTIALGELTEQMMIDYTLVLKGHISLTMAVFPVGTRGVHLDILARQHLWSHGLNYGHGTGHGVGAFLNVHEGPQSIRQQDNGVVIQEGMITSNEPGIYRANEYGIRIENLILCQEKLNSTYGRFLEFDTITLCPIDKRPIKKDMMTKVELEWLNSYHAVVFKKLAPFLGDTQQEWLKQATAEI